MSDIPGQPDQWDSPAAGATPADLGQRLIAKLVDFVMLWVVYAFILAPIFFSDALSGGAVGGFSFSGTAFVAGLVGIAVYLAYFVVMETTRGQTLGKMLLNLRVRGAAGGNPTFDEALKRNGWIVLGIVPVIGGLATLVAAVFILMTINNNTATRQGWHDEFAGGTSVIKER